MVELVVAMVIIGLVVIVLIGIQISAALTIADARVRQEATAFANEAVEQMRAIPWNVLSKGLDHDFLSVSGGDPYVTSGNVVIDDRTEKLVVALATQDQNLAQPWQPLFSSTGSNKQIRTDASGLATTYTIRAYVTELPTPSLHGVGIVVVVDWESNKGRAEHTTARTAAYRGAGCGNLDNQPYMGACQALLDAQATSGSIVSQLSATSDPETTDPVISLPLLGPSTTNWVYLQSMRTAGVAASVSSQQVTIAKAVDQYGGTVIDDNDPATQPLMEGWSKGFAFYQLQASDDPVSSDYPINPADLLNQPSSGDETPQEVQDSGMSMRIWGLSDYRRHSTADASSLDSCIAGSIPAKQPCARATITNYADLDGGSGYVLMEVEGTIIRLSRRLSEASSNEEKAWAARFITAPSTSASVGCTTITGEGCVSAGAERTMATLAIGTVVTGVGSWDGSALDGIVLVQGTPVTCPNGLTESVLSQRGASQKTTVSTVSRCGRITYWGASGYTSLDIDKNTNTTRDTTPVTWTHGNYSITAEAHVAISKFNDLPTGAVDCIADACVVNADAGVITITATYTITHISETWVLTSWTTINPPSAMASYKKAPPSA